MTFYEIIYPHISTPPPLYFSFTTPPPSFFCPYLSTGWTLLQVVVAVSSQRTQHPLLSSCSPCPTTSPLSNPQSVPLPRTPHNSSTRGQLEYASPHPGIRPSQPPPPILNLMREWGMEAGKKSSHNTSTPHSLNPIISSRSLPPLPPAEDSLPALFPRGPRPS